MDLMMRRRALMGMLGGSKEKLTLLLSNTLETPYGLITPISYDSNTKILEVDTIGGLTNYDSFTNVRTVPRIIPATDIPLHFSVKVLDNTHLLVNGNYTEETLLQWTFAYQYTSMVNIADFKNLVKHQPGNYCHEIIGPCLCWNYDTLGVSWMTVESWAPEYNRYRNLVNGKIYFTIDDSEKLTITNMVMTYYTTDIITKEYTDSGTATNISTAGVNDSYYAIGVPIISNYYLCN